MTIQLESFISQTLAPTFALSAVVLLTISLHNRILTINGRVRDLDKELRGEVTTERIDNIEMQNRQMLRRTTMLKNALFLLYSSMGLLVLTELFIAFQQLDVVVNNPTLPITTFIAALFVMFIAVMIDAFAMTINLKTMEMDVEYSLALARANATPAKKPTKKTTAKASTTKTKKTPTKTKQKTATKKSAT